MTQADRGPPSIAVIVPVRNKREVVRPALDSIVRAAEHAGVEVIAVDNGSTDGSLEIVRSYEPRARVYRARGTIAAVRNHGATRTTADLLCFLDSDVVVPEDFFIRVERAFARGNIAATGYPVALPPQPTWVERTWHGLHELGPRAKPGYINSGNFAVTRRAFQAVGGFDERLQTGEDTDICWRLREAGFPIEADPALEAGHLDNPKTIAAFFRKQVWHGQGMSRGRPLRTPCRVTLATAAFVLLSLCGVGGLVASPSLARGLGAFAILHLAVPAAAAAARVRRGGRAAAFLPGIVLYQVYFLARSVALARLLARPVGEAADVATAQQR